MSMYFSAGSRRQRINEGGRFAYPLIISLVLHALVFSPAPDSWPRLRSFAGTSGEVRATLARVSPAVVATPESAPGAATLAYRPTPRQSVRQYLPHKAAARAEAPRATERKTPETGQAPTAEPGPSAIDPVGLRQYQLALARNARQFRNYPDEARVQGWKGRINLRLAISENGVPLGVSLLGSSGFALLDRAASDMMLRAATLTELPESLRGRRFNVDLAIDYTPEDAP